MLCSFECDCPFDPETLERLSAKMKCSKDTTQVLEVIKEANNASFGGGCCIQVLKLIPRGLV